MKPFDQSVAKSLLKAVDDSALGFEQIGENSANFALYTYASHRAILRRDLATNLRLLIVAHGLKVEPESGARNAGKSLYLQLKSALIRGRRSTVRELARGETDLLHRLEVTLVTVAMPSAVANVVRDLYRCVSESKLELTALGASARKPLQWRGRPS